LAAGRTDANIRHRIATQRFHEMPASARLIAAAALPSSFLKRCA
jgi:hypothetical protein